MSHVPGIAARFAWNYLFNHGRPLPTFLIIGTQKGGTSSLFEYLLEHPAILGSQIKEVQYFTRRYWVGPRGYRAFFPRIRKSTRQVGESTPYYLFSPEAPERASQLLPELKIIALLRDPVERAYSHYQHNRRRGHETRSFEECVKADIQNARDAGGPGRLPGENDYSFRHRSYVRRGLYADQVARWLEFYPADHIRLFRAEDFFANPAEITAQTIEFLGLPAYPIDTRTAHNQFAYDKKRQDQFPELAAYFHEPNEKLKELTGISWGEQQ